MFVKSGVCCSAERYLALEARVVQSRKQVLPRRISGSVVNTIVTPWAEQKWDVPTAVWVGTLSCLGSFLSAVALTTLIGTTTPPKDMEETENYSLLSGVTGVTTDDTDRTDDMNSEMYLTAPLANEEDQNLLSPHSQVPFQPPIIPQFPGILRREASFVESINSVRFSPGIAKSGTRPSLYITTDRSNEQETWWSQWWSDLKFFPSTFWLLCALTVLLYGTVVPFNNIASDFLQSKWYHNNPRKAAAVMGIPDTLGAVLVPGFGLVVDRFGRRASALIASALIMVIVHTTLGFTTLSPIFAFSLLGIAYTMYGVALWPSIACVVTSELHLGKGYGISSSFLNISLTVVPPIVATIRVVGESFIPVEMFFIFTGLCGVLVGFALKAIDRRDGGKLEVPEIQVEVPVIVPQSSGCGPNSTAPSPSISQKRLKKRNRPALPTLDMYRITSSDLNDLEMRKNGGEGSIAQNSSSSLSRKARDDSDCPTASRSSALFRNSPNLSHASERLSKQGWWKSRPSLHKSLAGIGSPLLQQYTASPRYGSMSSPSLSAVIRDDMWDIENGAKLESGSQGYSVSQHPILYNPLRGSSGSFRISRSARLVAFGEGEEGCIYVDGQAIETGHEDQSNASESDSETEDRVVNEQAGSSTSFSSEVNREGEDDITITTSSNTLTEDATEPL
ncbi:hypothetical protein BGZ49_002808 [Haplosporangium sp. Z 27]|nr:hypothetical protein BGZ49_002808 [Haplosporangium sp. Z 27]